MTLMIYDFKTRRCVDSNTPWFDAFIGRVVLERDIAHRFWKANRKTKFAGSA
jgi:hypothetical protein